MSYNDILREQILTRLRYDNPWWVYGKIPSDFSAMNHRLYMNLFFPLVFDMSVRRSVILMGPRRVGKTVMIYHTIEKLIKEGVNPQKIIYVSVETPIYSNIPLEELFDLARQALLQKENYEGFYVFYDEIQYLKDWELHLTSLTDSYRKTKFIASGSAAAALKKKSNESGAGRFTDFMLPPLTFFEYINLLGYENLIIPKTIHWAGTDRSVFDTIDIDKLNEHFLNYINFGGYPEILFSDKIKSDPGQYILHDIVDKVLLRDLPSLYGISDTQELNRLFNYIAFRSGCEFSYENISKESEVKKETLKKYIQYLEAAFLIKVVHKIDMKARFFQRITAFKIYLTNPSLRCALFSPIKEDDEAMGNLVETAIYAQWIQRENNNVYYANWSNGKKNGEVDIVGLDTSKLKPSWAVEIKWSDRYYDRPADLKSLLQFLENNNINEAIVSSKKLYGQKELKTLSLQFIPSSIYAYIVGKNTIEKKQQAMGL